MENELITVDLLGKIYIEDIFLYYDEPVLFSCVNSLSNHFLTVLLDYESNSKTWLYLPISEARLIHAKKGLISLYELFKNPEETFLWKVYENDNLFKGKAINVLPDKLSDDELPSKDSFIEWEATPNTILPEENSKILEISKKERRDIFDISLEPKGGHSHEIDCETLGTSLRQIQSTIYQIANRKKKSLNISEKVKRQNKLNVTETYAASFGVRLKSETLTDFLGYSALQGNIITFMDLLDTKNNEIKLKELLQDYNPHVAIKYYMFLKTLFKTETSLKISSAFPNDFYRKVQLTNDEIKQSLNLIESEINNSISIEEYDGKLVGANVVQKTFEFISSEDDKISGIIAEDVDVDEYRLPRFAHIKVQEQIEINEITHREIIKYELLGLYYLNEDKKNNIQNINRPHEE